MNYFTKLSKKNLASDNIWRQIWGALLQFRPRYLSVFVFLVIPITAGVSAILLSVAMPTQATTAAETVIGLPLRDFLIKSLSLLGLNIVVWLTIKVCRSLIAGFNLRRKDSNITWCYIIILAAIGLWLIFFVLIFDIKANGKIAAAIGIIGGVLGWIFQDKVKGVVAFFHLRMHHLLSVGDWIKIDKLGVYGEVQKMTLTSVTIYNWDTTTSTIPISALQSDHFINLQNMMSGKTHGRRMLKSFIIDTSTFRIMSAEELKKLAEEYKEHPFFIYDEDKMKDGVLNAHIYRMYIYHWLMQNEHVSQFPRLMVRWMEQSEGGMPLQIYAFIIDSSLPSFEWQQSLIIEHVISSLDKFGLRLYQKPSGDDMRSRKGGQQ